MEQLRLDIYKVLNSEGHNNLPLAAKFYIVKDIYRDLEQMYYRSLNTQQEEKPDEQNVHKD